jgi:predicted Zn-dependent protease
MKYKLGKSKLVAAGALSANVLVAVLVSVITGGCGKDPGGLIGGVAQSVATGNTSALTGGGGKVSTGEMIQRGGGIVKQAAQAASLNAEDERALGQTVALQATGKWGLVNDDNLNRYVLMVAQTLADATPEGGRPVAGVLATDEVNAFSGPSGYIMITRGLLARLQDEAELAGVLAHEMGHVVRRHGLDAVQRDQYRDAFAKTLTIAQRDSLLLDFGKELGKKIMETPYNLGQEYEADREAVRIMAAAGYDASGYIRALQRLSGTQRARPGINFFPTHPGIPDRIRNLQSEVARQTAAGPRQTNAERFKQMVFGQ